MALLIVNADDYGFFDGVSAGIVDAVVAGAVTATGVMSNGPAFARWSEQLRSHPEVDVGVHLNATFGRPLTAGLPRSVLTRRGELPDKRALALALMRHKLAASEIAAEWRAQIERCLREGLQIRFLNSHEHVHMLPALSPVIRQLAREYRVPHVRRTDSQWSLAHGPGSLFRTLVIKGLNLWRTAPGNAPKLLGLPASGRLDMQYLHATLPQLNPAAAYELMCHPGRDDAEASAHQRLRLYHDWSGELRCLLGAEFRDALRRYSVRTIRFRDLALAG
jgi:chitin disaccharide deacetylase